MPASSFSALNSWGFYIIAAAALLLVLSPPLLGTAQDARAASDWRSADGVRAILDSLRPGVRVHFSYGGSRGWDNLTLGDRKVSVSYGGGTISLPTRWELTSETLVPAKGYVAFLQGGVAEVVPAG